MKANRVRELASLHPFDLERPRHAPRHHPEEDDGVRPGDGEHGEEERSRGAHAIETRAPPENRARRSRQPILAMRFCISSGGTSSTCCARVQVYPSGSWKRPERSP